MFFKNMTDYVCYVLRTSQTSALAGGQDQKRQINSADQGPDQDQQQKQSRTRPAAEGRGGKSNPHTHRQLGKFRGVKGALRRVLTRSCSPPVELGAARAAASGRALDPLKGGAEPSDRRSKKGAFCTLIKGCNAV